MDPLFRHIGQLVLRETDFGAKTSLLRNRVQGGSLICGSLRGARSGGTAPLQVCIIGTTTVSSFLRATETGYPVSEPPLRGLQR